MSRVIVAIDGSKGANHALAFAAEEARMRGATLEVVHVRQPVRVERSFLGAEYTSGAALDRMLEYDRQRTEQAEEQSRQAAEGLLARAIDAVDTAGITVETTSLMDGRPARRLVGLVNGGTDVDLLVVGSRGRGELTGALLGSVSQACVTHARVPVAVVHRPSD